MKTAPVGTVPLQNPPTAKKKYTPATVLMSGFTRTPLLLFPNPQYSHIVSPVTRANNASIPIGVRKPATTIATNSTPVTERTMRFANLLFFFSSVISHQDYLLSDSILSELSDLPAVSKPSGLSKPSEPSKLSDLPEPSGLPELSVAFPLLSSRISSDLLTQESASPLRIARQSS